MTDLDGGGVSRTTGTTFVLVHGAWHGGWCWSRVQDRLVSRGARVFAPSLAGLGDRSNELSPGIDLDRHVQDIVDLIESEDLRDVILVGHSYGGIVISGVADRLSHRIVGLVFLDGVVLESGQRWCDIHPPVEAARRLEMAVACGNYTFPVPAADRWGLTPADRAWVEAHMTPHPAGTYTSTLRLRHPLGNGLPLTYLDCRNPRSTSLDATKRVLRNDPRWQFVDLDTGHDAMVSAPELVAEHLMMLAGRQVERHMQPLQAD